MGAVPELHNLDAEWFRSNLDLNGAYDVHVTPIGSGQVANCYRIEVLREDLPTSSFIAKVPSNDETSRATAKLQHLYGREVSFYQQLANKLSIRSPQCFFAQRDDDDNFLLLLEDMSPVTPLDQFTGLNIEQAREGLRMLAGLHAPTSGDTQLHNQSWLRGVSEGLKPLLSGVLPMFFDQFLERYAEQINATTESLIRDLRERLSLFSGYQPPLPSVTHGDFRTDNLLIDAQGGRVPMAVVDWQTIAVTSPLLDVAYFVITSLSEPDVEAHENELLDFYLEQLQVAGLRYPSELARQEFARYTLQPVVMLVAASVIVERTERGDHMFLSMIEKAVTAATRWRALEELERHAATQ